MQFYTKSGLLALCDNGLVAEVDECPCETRPCGCDPVPTITEANTAFVPSMPTEFGFANPIIFSDINSVTGVSYIVLNGGTHTPTTATVPLIGYNNPSVIGFSTIQSAWNCIVGDVNDTTNTVNAFTNCIIQNVSCSDINGFTIDSCSSKINNCGTTVSDGIFGLYGNCNDYTNIYTANGINGTQGGDIYIDGSYLTFNGVITGDGSDAVNSLELPGAGGCIDCGGHVINFANIIFGNGANSLPGNPANYFSAVTSGSGGGGFGGGGAGGYGAGYGAFGSDDSTGYDGESTDLCGTLTFANIIFGSGGLGNTGIVIVDTTGGATSTVTSHSGNGGDGGYSGCGGDGGSFERVRNDNGVVEDSYYGDGGDGGQLTTDVAIPAGIGGIGYPPGTDGTDGVVIPCS